MCQAYEAERRLVIWLENNAIECGRKAFNTSSNTKFIIPQNELYPELFKLGWELAKKPDTDGG